MIKSWHDGAWNDYVYWQSQDRKTLRKINSLLSDIERNGESKGIGKPEPLHGNLSGWWSRRIDDKNRVVYRIKNKQLELLQCGSHYRDK